MSWWIQNPGSRTLVCATTRKVIAQNQKEMEILAKLCDSFSAFKITQVFLRDVHTRKHFGEFWFDHTHPCTFGYYTSYLFESVTCQLLDLPSGYKTKLWGIFGNPH